MVLATPDYVNAGGYMDFKTATDTLSRTLTQAEIAEVASVSHAAIRQARLDPQAASYRPPPRGWDQAIAKLARERAGELVNLAEELEG